MKIRKYLRKLISKILPVDEEKERVMRELLKKMQNHHEWHLERNEYEMTHNEFNIKVNAGSQWIVEPEDIKIPFKWRTHIWEHNKILRRMKEVNELHFAYNVISGNYMYQSELRGKDKREGHEQWLKENASKSDYIIKEDWIYFSEETTAMAFKLTFD